MVEPNILIAQVEPPQNEEGGDYYYRTLLPGKAMAALEGVYVVNLTNHHRNKDFIMREADILILKNLSDVDLLPIVRERKNRRQLTVFEIADDLGDVQPWSPVYFFYRNPENFNIIKRLTRLSDALQVTTESLKELYGHLNPAAEVFPNHINILPTTRAANKTSGLNVGWGGSHGHQEDIAAIAPGLIRWIKSHHGACLHLMCSEPILALFQDLPDSKKKWTKPGDINTYYEFLKDIDIGLAPLCDTGFNRARSDVKFLEYAVSGVVPVVQNLTPYRNSVQERETGFFFTDEAELLAILDKLDADRVLLEHVAQASRAYVMAERLQGNHGIDRVRFYRNLLSAIGWKDRTPDAVSASFRALTRLEGSIQDGRHIRLLPTRFEALLFNGLVLSQVHDNRAQAQQFFAEAARLEPHNYLPYLFGASVSNDPIASLAKAASLNKHSVKARLMLGDAQVQLGNAIEALQAFESAAQIFPDYDIPYLRAVDVLRQIGQSQAAEDVLLKAQALAIR